MVDGWLIGVSVVTGVLMLAIILYTFLLYCHPDDNPYIVGWLAKGVVVAAFMLIWCFIMLLPLDVSNSRKAGGGLNLDLAYQITFILAFCFIGFVIPFTLFLYESDDEKPIFGRLFRAFISELVVLVGVGVLAVIAWAALRRVQVADLMHTTLADLQLSEVAIGPSGVTQLTGRVTYLLPPYLFVCILLLFIGWFCFIFFGAIGLIYLPFDLVMGYVYRPKPRSALEMAERKIGLRRRCEELSAFARALEGTAGEGGDGGFLARWQDENKLSTKSGKLNKELYLLEEEIAVFEAETRLTANPLFDIAKLVGGSLLACLSLVILLHLLLYELIIINNRPASLFLNSFLFLLEFNLAPFISTIFFGLFGTYLVICVLKGTVAFGLRVFFIMKVHPMKPGGTYMNSFLFNSGITLLGTLGAVHFTVLLFLHYMRLTAGAALFGTLITRVNGLRVFWQYKVFFYAFVALMLLSAAVLVLKPKSGKLDVRAVVERSKGKKT